MTLPTVAIGLVMLVLATGCTGGAVVSGTASAARSSPRRNAGPAATFPALSGTTDAETQYLSDVADSDGVLVAAGGSHSNGVWRAVPVLPRRRPALVGGAATQGQSRQRPGPG